MNADNTSLPTTTTCRYVPASNKRCAVMSAHTPDIQALLTTMGSLGFAKARAIRRAESWRRISSVSARRETLPLVVERTNSVSGDAKRAESIFVPFTASMQSCSHWTSSKREAQNGSTQGNASVCTRKALRPASTASRVGSEPTAKGEII